MQLGQFSSLSWCCVWQRDSIHLNRFLSYIYTYVDLISPSLRRLWVGRDHYTKEANNCKTVCFIWRGGITRLVCVYSGATWLLLDKFLDVYIGRRRKLYLGGGQYLPSCVHSCPIYISSLKINAQTPPYIEDRGLSWAGSSLSRNDA